MARGRFRVFRGAHRRSARYDGATAAGIGESIRVCTEIDDEGDAELEQLIARLDQIPWPLK